MEIKLSRVAELMNTVCGTELNVDDYQNCYMVDNGSDWKIIKK